MASMKQREKLIKARQERLARDAKKQGITPEQLLKKKRDTYLNVVGGAALGALPFGAILRGATSLFKGIGGAAKVSTVGKTVAKGAKKVADTTKKLKTSKTPTKDVKKTSIPKVKVKSMKGSGASGASKEVMKKTPTKTTKTTKVLKTQKDFDKVFGKQKPTIGKASKKDIKETQKILLRGNKKPKKQTKKTDTKKKVSGSTLPKVIGAAGAASVLTSLISKKDGSAQAMPKSRPSSIKPKTKKDFGMGRMDDFGQGRRKGSPEGGTAPIKPKKKTPSKPTPKMEDMPKKKSKNITAGGNVGFGPKGNIFPSNSTERKKLMDKYGGTGSAAAKAAAQGKQGSLKKVGRT